MSVYKKECPYYQCMKCGSTFAIYLAQNDSNPRCPICDGDENEVYLLDTVEVDKNEKRY